MENKGIKETADAIRENVSRVIVGNHETIDLMLTAILAGGHVLIEDIPGTGKTMLAKAFAKSMDGEFRRVQFTPDLMPSDITGLNVYNQRDSAFTLVKGPVFTNILLADEINRATPRTQSSLLEAMEERQVTIDGETLMLPAPFVVLATENPIDTIGTYPLPEAQLDRFIMRISMGERSGEQELRIIDRFISETPLSKLNSVCGMEEVAHMQEMIKQIHVHDCIRAYIVGIIMATRTDGRLSSGVSSRGTLALVRCCQAYAAIQGREYVVPDDVILLAPYVLGHRVITFGGGNRLKKNSGIIRDIVGTVEVPLEKWEI